MEVHRQIEVAIMKIVVIGGSGLIGVKARYPSCASTGTKQLPHLPNSGVNTHSRGEGLAEALKGASVVVDVSKLSLVGRLGCDEVLRDIKPVTSSPMEAGRRRRTSRCAVCRRI